MKQKLNYILTFLILFSSVSLMAQRPSFNPEEIKAKMRAEKVAYLTTRISLTPEEAVKFWPVYNEFDDKRVDIQIARYNLEGKIKRSKETLSDVEIIKFINDYNSNKLQEEALNAKYYERFLKMLPPKKVLALYQVEKEFLMFLNNRGGNRSSFNFER